MTYFTEVEQEAVMQENAMLQVSNVKLLKQYKLLW